MGRQGDKETRWWGEWEMCEFYLINEKFALNSPDLSGPSGSFSVYSTLNPKEGVFCEEARETKNELLH